MTPSEPTRESRLWRFLRLPQGSDNWPLDKLLANLVMMWPLIFMMFVLLLTGLFKETGTLVITDILPRAAIYVDGELLPCASEHLSEDGSQIDMEAPVGEHILEVSVDGEIVHSSRFEVLDEAIVHVNAAFEEDIPPTP